MLIVYGLRPSSTMPMGWEPLVVQLDDHYFIAILIIEILISLCSLPYMKS